MKMLGTHDVDPYLPNAYSNSRVRFDLASYAENQPKQKNYDEAKSETPDAFIKDVQPKNIKLVWELDVKGLVSTKKWLQVYGLKKNKLDISSLMNRIGFKKRDDFDKVLRKPIPSKYVVNKFMEHYITLDGKTTNVSVSKEQLRQIATQLSQAQQLFKRRLEWLTTESRRVFGVIQESTVVIILDIKTLSPQQFDQYRCAVERVLQEQISSIAKFNLIRATDEMRSFRQECVPVSQRSVEEAVDWLWTLDRTSAVGQTSTCEAVLKALCDTQAMGVYLFTEGTAAESSIELMLSNCKESQRPLHIVSYNCTDSNVLTSLKNLCECTHGRFHAYGIVMELDSFDGLPTDGNSTKALASMRKRMLGGVPSGAGVRDDVLLLFEEMEEARSNMAQIEALVQTAADSKSLKYHKSSTGEVSSKHSNISEEYMGSTDWLSVNGLKCKRLTFYDLLGKVAFKHCDGVINIKEAPAHDDHKTDANTKEILVNARYCDQFAHVKWKDGTIVHIQITPETHRIYAEQVAAILSKIEHRINWLQQGSRELFGTIIERRLYILIDTSGSMAPSLQFVKDKLYLLLQEQIRHKDAFNIVSYGSKINPWRDRLVEVNEESLKAAWSWIKALEPDGSTNTLGALKYALADASTEGIYLLTDGRPDHPPKSVLAQVNLQKPIPIHAISFNCADGEANKFLYNLAKESRGRYHYFSEHGQDTDGPEAYQSEDIRKLKEELALGENILEKVAKLRDECMDLQWRRSGIAKLTTDSLGARVPRPKSAIGFQSSRQAQPPVVPLPTSHSEPTLHVGHHNNSWSAYRRVSSSYIKERKPSVAMHTRTSLLRSLSVPRTLDWVVPETKRMLNMQFTTLDKPTSPATVSRRNSQTVLSRDEKVEDVSKKMAPAKLMSSKNWLQKNSLRAQKLTLVEALRDASNIDPRKPSLKVDSRLAACLFKEDLSSHDSTMRAVILGNPSLETSLLGYEKRLTEAVDKYSKRLDRVVQRALVESAPSPNPDASGQQQPESFIANKLHFMNLLDTSSINKKDLQLLEDEIGTAKQCIEDSQKIRNFAVNYEPSESVLHNLHALSETITVKTKTAPPSKSNRTGSRTTEYLPGHRVVARQAAHGFFYSGLVLKSKGPHHAVVRFDEGEEELVPKQHIIPIKGAIAVPSLTMGDYVLVLVKGSQEVPCYAPGQIQLTPKDSQNVNGRFYEVMLYNGHSVSALRNSMVKIGKSRYNLSVAFIHERSGQDENAKSENSEDGEQDVDTINQDDQNASVLRALGQYHSRLEELCNAIIRQQRESKSNQKRLHKQMRRIHKSYKVITSDKKDAEVDHSHHVVLTSLDSVEPGEEVLARWHDEGWYYRCQVQRRISQRMYILQDSCGDLQQTPRDDIIGDNDDMNAKIEMGCCVVALHPNYYCSYAPGIVDEVFDDFSCSVKFYDGTRSIVEREEIFISDQEMHKRDIGYILQCEEEMVGRAVVARDNNTGDYALGSIKSHLGKRQYLIEWSTGSQSKQSCIHIFGVFNKSYAYNVGDHCLSMYDGDMMRYLPGVVTGLTATGLDIKFINGAMVHDVNPLKSFWISNNYYDAASAYYSNRHRESTHTP